MGRSILAVVAGLAAIFIVVMVATLAASALLLPPAPDGGFPEPTPPYLVVNLAYSLAAAIAGGYLAGRLAGRRPLIHAAVLAAILTIMSIASAMSGGGMSSGAQPVWYCDVMAVIGVVGVLLGGWARRRQLLDPIVS